MKNCGKVDILLLGLTLLLAAQFSFLVTRLVRQPTSTVPWLEVGDTLKGIQAIDSAGRDVPIVGGGSTVLLVFRSDCGHCEEVAPRWRRWLEGKTGHRVIAVTSEPRVTAEGFLSRHRLEVELVTVEDHSLRDRTYALTARTPWVFILGREGVIRAHGHGAQIQELEKDPVAGSRWTDSE